MYYDMYIYIYYTYIYYMYMYYMYIRNSNSDTMLIVGVLIFHC